jgi:hypothetical protein
MGDVLGAERSIRFLGELASKISEYLPYLERHLEIQRERGRINGAYALEQGIARYETAAVWARRVARELEST